MHQKLIFTAVILFFCQIAMAGTCPSLTDIKHNRLHGWKAYDSVSHQPLANARIAMLKKYAAQFVLAEWPDSQRKTGAIRCYYRDKEGSDFQAYFSKSNLVPTDLKNDWYQVTGSTDCAANINKCSFQALPTTTPHHLAKAAGATG